MLGPRIPAITGDVKLQAWSLSKHELQPQGRSPLMHGIQRREGGEILKHLHLLSLTGVVCEILLRPQSFTPAPALKLETRNIFPLWNNYI